MTPHEYWTQRGKLGQALRDLRWERRAIYTMFRNAQCPELRAQGSIWHQAILLRDAELCKQIQALDVRYELEKQWKT